MSTDENSCALDSALLEVLGFFGSEGFAESLRMGCNGLLADVIGVVVGVVAVDGGVCVS